jgi:cell wall-associated NlpC family hydrolase
MHSGSLLMMTGLLALASVGCATSGNPVPRPFPGAPVASAPAAPDAPVTPDAPVAPAALDAPVAPVAPVAPAAPDLRAGRFDGRAIAEFALGFRGVPYRLGGSDPNGFDCSGLVQYVFAQYGIVIPRVVEQQYEVGDKIRPNEIRPGDLIFFDTERRGPSGASHVAIAIGPDRFVHAPNSTGVVRVETLGSSYWGARYLGARRVANSVITN